jgi:hypothetical protein
MRRAVVLCGRQKPRVVGEMEALRERRDELVGRKTTERAIFRRDDDVKPPRRRGDELLAPCAAKFGDACCRRLRVLR